MIQNDLVIPIIGDIIGPPIHSPMEHAQGGGAPPTSSDPLILWGNAPFRITSYWIDDEEIFNQVYFDETGGGTSYYEQDFITADLSFVPSIDGAYSTGSYLVMYEVLNVISGAEVLQVNAAPGTPGVWLEAFRADLRLNDPAKDGIPQEQNIRIWMAADDGFGVPVAGTETYKDVTYYSSWTDEIIVSDIVESANLGCDWNSTIGQTQCIASAAYASTILGTPVSYAWSLSSIVGGAAIILSGQGTDSCVIQTDGSSAAITYDLTLTAKAPFQSPSRLESFSQAHTDLPTPIFTGPPIDTTELVEDILMTPFDVSSRFTGEDAGGWSLEGSWPSGLTIDANGLLEGTPPDLGTFPGLTFRASNANGFTDSNVFTIEVVEAAAVIAPVFVPSVPTQIWEVGVFATLDLRAFFTGSTASYTLTAGTLIDGMALDPSGVVSGTPTGNESQLGLEFTATNAAGNDTTNAFDTHASTPALFVGPIADQSWQRNVLITPLDISGDFTGLGLTFALAPTSDAIQTGLAFSTAGVFTGTPTEEAIRDIIVRATNLIGFADSNSFEIDVFVTPISNVAIVEDTPGSCTYDGV